MASSSRLYGDGGGGPPRCAEHGFELVGSTEMEAEDLLNARSMASSLPPGKELIGGEHGFKPAAP
jgi:hypothetical protein